MTYAVTYKVPRFSEIAVWRFENEEAAKTFCAQYPEHYSHKVFTDQASFQKACGVGMVRTFTNKLAGTEIAPDLQKLGKKIPDIAIASEAIYRVLVSIATVPDGPVPTVTAEDPPDEVEVSETEGDTAMAAKKTKSKKAPKDKKPRTPRAKGTAKKSEGAPREGTKAAKLLNLLMRPNGATLTEMLNTTGWKECRGTALELAARVGKKMSIVKEEGKVTRWVIK